MGRTSMGSLILSQLQQLLTTKTGKLRKEPKIKRDIIKSQVRFINMWAAFREW